MELENAMRTTHKISCAILNADYLKSFTASRKRELVLSRQVTMALSKDMFPKKTLSDVGSFFGKDHATVLHAKKTVTNLIDTDKNFKSNYEYIDKVAKRNVRKKSKQKKTLTKHEIVVELKKLTSTNDIHLIIEINDLLNQL